MRDGAPRFPVLAPETMTPRQRQMAEEFLGFSLNGLRGPFNIMLRSPEAAAAFQALGRYLRFQTGIDDRLIELAVLVHARLWSDQYEWKLHAPRAADKGLSQATIADLRIGRTPTSLDEREETIFRFALELERDHKVCEETFRMAIERFGERGVADLTFLLGQYSTISMLLATAEEDYDLDHLPACEQPFDDYPPA